MGIQKLQNNVCAFGGRNGNLGDLKFMHISDKLVQRNSSSLSRFNAGNSSILYIQYWGSRVLPGTQAEPVPGSDNGARKLLVLAIPPISNCIPKFQGSSTASTGVTCPPELVP
eukprot:752273-Hanusia_phi.AAC.4